MFCVYRCFPDDDSNLRIDTYEGISKRAAHGVRRAHQVKNEVDQTLAFRRSCREAVCVPKT